jgi:hypothetical protein
MVADMFLAAVVTEADLSHANGAEELETTVAQVHVLAVTLASSHATGVVVQAKIRAEAVMADISTEIIVIKDCWCFYHQ